MLVAAAILLGLTVGAPASTAVWLAPPNPTLADALSTELGAEARLVPTATAAEIRARVIDGHHLQVRGSDGALLVERQVRASVPATIRIFVALIAQAVRSHRAVASPPPRGPPPSVGAPPDVEPDAGPAPRVRPPPPTPPEAEASTAVADSATTPPPARDAGSPAPARGPTADLVAPPGPPGAVEAAAETSTFGLDLAAVAGVWTSPVSPRLGLTLAGAWQLGGLRLGGRVTGAWGPPLRTADIEATIGRLALLAEAGYVLPLTRSVELVGQVGAGAGLLLGDARAREPTFADPGTPIALRRLEPLIRPAVILEWAVSEGWALTAAAFLRVALLTHAVNLPATFSERTEAPLVTDRAQPGLAIGVRWAPFAAQK